MVKTFKTLFKKQLLFFFFFFLSSFFFPLTMSLALVNVSRETVLLVSLRWRLQEVFLKLEDGQQIPVFKVSGNTEHEVKTE